MLITLLSGLAQAFCGTYVAGSGVEISNQASQVAVVRQGTRTTLTLASDFEGAVGEFALVLPVPVVLEADDVRVLDPAVFERLDAYSAPRLVEYTCEQLYPAVPEPERSASLGCHGTSLTEIDNGQAGIGYDSQATVESRFIVGEYDVVVLSAHDSADLLQWLSDQGYAVSSAAAEAIQSYLDQGSYFLAAKVDPDRIPAGRDELSPLRLSYESDGFGLPIRLGTVNAADQAQDVVIYAITEPDQGQVGISNYPQAELDSVCLWDDTAWDDLGAFYAAELDAALDGHDRAHWVVEYGWSVDPKSTFGKCDPCPTSGVNGVDPLPYSDVVALGFDTGDGALDTGRASSDWRSLEPFHFTRLHVRYTPEQATQDLALYTSGITENTQQRYVLYAPYLEWEFPLCDGGWLNNPESCADEAWAYRKRMHWDEPDSSTTGRSGAAGLLGLLGLLVWARRGRRVTARPDVT
jgi:MYXO-CTERM domain-containing protein